MLQDSPSTPRDAPVPGEGREGPGIRVEWGAELVEGRFLHRPNRFVVHAEVGGEEVEAHLADPGRLEELMIPGARMGFRPEPPSETRRTRWTALLVESPESRAAPDEPAAWVSVNTTMPNRLVGKALEAGVLEEFDGWRYAGREVSYGSSRLDFVLEEEDGPHGKPSEGPAPTPPRKLWVEAKSVTLVEDGLALFPDAVTARGARHVNELRRAVEEGHEAAVLFVLQRPDARRIVAARAIDPTFAEALERAEVAGVRVLGRRCRVDWEGIELRGRVPAGAD